MQDNQNIKIVLTGGCSFSQVPNSDVTWPVHLCEALGLEGIHGGRGAAGNGIISRLATYNLIELLKTYKPEEILVGIMWSGADRHDMYSNDENFPHTKIFYGDDHEVYRNPLKIAGKHKHYILNSHWTDESTETFFKKLHDRINMYIITIEHILRMQFMLKSMGIKYFFTSYAPDTFPLPQELENPDLKFLYDLIDFDNFLKVQSCDHFAKNISKYDYARWPDEHPSSEQHRDFTNQFILPHLVEKNYIKSYSPLEIDEYSMFRNGGKILLKNVSV
jgi:hypothetical protein